MQNPTLDAPIRRGGAAGRSLRRALAAGLTRRGLLLAGMAAVHLLMLSSLVTGWLNPVFDDRPAAALQAHDFFSVYEAGVRVLRGENAYAPESTGATPHATYFRYVPAFLPAAAAFTLLPPRAAYWLWVAVLEGLLALNVWKTWRLAPEPGLRLATAALWLLSAPYYFELYLGQFSFLMATLLFWSACAFREGRDRRAGAAWAASLFVKTYPVLMAPGLWRAGHRRLVAGSLAALVALSAPYLLLVPGAWAGFSAVNGGSFSHVTLSRMHHGVLGFQAFLRHLNRIPEVYLGMSPVWAEMAVPFLWACAVGVVILVASLAARRPDPVPAMALAVTGYFLMFRDVWEHYFVVMVAVCVALALLQPDLRRWALACGVLFALPTPYALLELAYPTGPGATEHLVWPLGVALAYFSLKAVPLLLLFLRLVLALVGPDRSSPRR
ncbi:MAG TPA: glycosyltransferase family 87 protein [Dehalococcoidia bacterium]